MSKPAAAAAVVPLYVPGRHPWAADIPGLRWKWLNDQPPVLHPGGELNCTNVLQHHPDAAGAFVYDAFADQMLVTRAVWTLPGPFPRPLADADDSAMAGWLEAQGLEAAPSRVHGMLLNVSRHNRVEPLQEWLGALKWDGQARLDTWLAELAQASGPWAALVGRKALIGAVARAMTPGCKVDNMPVLEGPQGTFKSSFIEALFGSTYYSDELGNITTSEGAQLLQGKWGIEAAELQALLNRGSAAVKAYLSRRVDRYRPPYGRRPVDRPRRSVVWGTHNPAEHGYIADATGGRRYWPVAVGVCNVHGLRRVRDQLWAEAFLAWKSGEPWWLDSAAEALAGSEQAERQDDDVWLPQVEEWLAEKQPTHVTTGWLLERVLGVRPALQDDRMKGRVGRVLVRLGWREHKRRALPPQGGARTRQAKYWWPPEGGQGS